MEFHLGDDLTAEGKDPEVCHEERVHTDFLQVAEILGELRYVRIVREDVYGHVDPLAQGVRERDTVAQVLPAEIAPERPETEGLAAEIDRIGAVEQRHLHLLRRPRRRQKFRFLHRSSV